MGEQVSERDDLARVFMRTVPDHHPDLCDCDPEADTPCEGAYEHADAALAWFAEHRGPRVVSARVVPSAEEVRDELSGWPIRSGYYGMSVGTDEAHEMAEAVLALFASQPTVAEVREQVAREIEAAMDQDAVRNGTHIVFDDVNRSGKRNAVLAIAARIARTETKGGE